MYENCNWISQLSAIKQELIYFGFAFAIDEFYRKPENLKNFKKWKEKKEKKL